MPAISVHIVTFNSVATIGICLEALRRQQLDDCQIVVLDNGSSDQTCQIVREANVPLIESSENLGYARAHNRLIDRSDAAYILTLNPDVYLLPNFLEAMQSVLDADKTLGSAAGCLLRVDHLGDPSDLIDSAGLAMRRRRSQRLLGELTSYQQCPVAQQPIWGPDGAAAFYRRAMLEDIRVMGEVFDADFFMHKEDVDVCWRAQLRGWASVYVPEATAYHVRAFRPGQRERVSPYMRFLGVRNRYLLMIKNEIPAHFLRDLPYIVAYDAGIVAYLFLRERQSLTALRSVWTLRQSMLQKRQVIQAQKKVGWREIAQWFSP